jgi:hypothetical protein
MEISTRPTNRPKGRVVTVPLIALQYHEVKINIDFESIGNLLKYGSTTFSASGVKGDLPSCSLWVDYIFLDTDERRRFAQLSHEYLIEQLQFTGDESVTGLNPKIKLNFNHPVKELIWVVQRDSQLTAGGSNNWTNYAADGVDTNGTVNSVKSAKLQLNGQDRFAERAGTYFNLVQPFQHHENVSTNVGINVYSFALKPEEHQPSGTLNLSRVDTAVLQLTLAAGVPNATVKSFATNYNVKFKRSALKSYPPRRNGLSSCSNRLGTHIKIPVASELKSKSLQDILLFGKPLRAPSTKVCVERHHWPRVMNLGTLDCEMQMSTVKMMKIGQPACLSPKSAMIGHGEASETERISVIHEGLVNLKWLKIQSKLLVKINRKIQILASCNVWYGRPRVLKLELRGYRKNDIRNTIVVFTESDELYYHDSAAAMCTYKQICKVST